MRNLASGLKTLLSLLCALLVVPVWVAGFYTQLWWNAGLAGRRDGTRFTVWMQRD